MITKRLMPHALIAAAAFVFSGCERKPSNESPLPDGGAIGDKYATADPKLEKALRAAADAAGASDNGPPPGGVFEQGVADQRHPKGAPTKVDLVSDGSEPRISLFGGANAAGRSAPSGPALLEIAVQMGPRAALPTIDFALLLRAAKGDDGGAGGAWVIEADVKKAVPAKDQPGQLSPDAEREIASLAGTQVLLKLGTDGNDGQAELKLSKQGQSELFAQNAEEALVLANVPPPPRPVGAGAQWIAETRMSMSGADVIAYRAYQVKSIDGDRLKLAVTVTSYATGKDLQLRGVPKGATLEQFEAQAQGKLELVAGEPLARRSDLEERLIMVFRAEGGQAPAMPEGRSAQGNLLTAQLQSQSSFVRGEELRAAASRRGGAAGEP